MATTVQPFIVGGRWPRRLTLANVVPEVVRGITQHAADYTEDGVAVAAGLIPAEVVAATESDPRIRAAALTDHRLRQLQLALFLRAPVDRRHLHELAVVGVVFAVWTVLPTMSEATMRMFMGTLVIHRDVLRPESDASPRGADAVREALSRCEAVAHGGDPDLLPEPPPGRRI